jgi:hypothetical protein
MSRSRSRVQNQRRKEQRNKRTLALGLGGLGLLLIVGAVVLLTRKGDAPAGFEPVFNGGPRVELSEDTYDYGYVQFNNQITTDVEMRNVGDEPLRIAGIPQVQVREGC